MSGGGGISTRAGVCSAQLTPNALDIMFEIADKIEWNSLTLSAHSEHSKWSSVQWTEQMVSVFSFAVCLIEKRKMISTENGWRVNERQFRGGWRDIPLPSFATSYVYNIRANLPFVSPFHIAAGSLSTPLLDDVSVKERERERRRRCRDTYKHTLNANDVPIWK